MNESWDSTTSGGHSVRNVNPIDNGTSVFCWRGEICLSGGQDNWEVYVWYADGSYYGKGPKSELDLVRLNQRPAERTGIEREAIQ